MTRIVLLVAIVFPSALAAGLDAWQEGVRLFRAEDFQGAQEAFERSVAEEPANSRYRLWLGLATGRRAERMTGIRRLGALPLAKQVKRHFEQAVELDRKNLEALEALQNFHLEAPGLAGGSVAEAKRLAEAIERVEAARGAAAWARYYERVGDAASSERQHQRARELEPKEVAHLLGHASFLSRQSRHEESDRLFEKALATVPGNPEVWFSAAAAWIEARRKPLYRRARELLENYLASPDRKLQSAPPFIVRRLLKRT